MLFETTLVMAVLDCEKDLEMYEAFILNVTKSLAGRTPKRCQRILHHKRSQCGVGINVYRRRRHRGTQ